MKQSSSVQLTSVSLSPAAGPPRKLSHTLLGHTFIFAWILTNGVLGCQPEFKRIFENVTLSCSTLPITEPVLWQFNNQAQITNSSFSGSVVVSEPYGRTLLILSHDMSVYGNYSCSFTNGTLINCFTLSIQVTPTASVTPTNQTAPTPTHTGSPNSDDNTVVDVVVASFTIALVLMIWLALGILAACRRWRQHKAPKDHMEVDYAGEIAAGTDQKVQLQRVKGKDRTGEIAGTDQKVQLKRVKGKDRTGEIAGTDQKVQLQRVKGKDRTGEIAGTDQKVRLQRVKGKDRTGEIAGTDQKVRLQRVKGKDRTGEIAGTDQKVQLKRVKGKDKTGEIAGTDQKVQLQRVKDKDRTGEIAGTDQKVELQRVKGTENTVNDQADEQKHV